jgi:hypothetical protein
MRGQAQEKEITLTLLGIGEANDILLLLDRLRLH